MGRHGKRNGAVFLGWRRQGRISKVWASSDSDRSWHRHRRSTTVSVGDTSGGVCSAGYVKILIGAMGMSAAIAIAPRQRLGRGWVRSVHFLLSIGMNALRMVLALFCELDYS